MLLQQWILVVGGCAIDVVDDNGKEIIYYFNA